MKLAVIVFTAASLFSIAAAQATVVTFDALATNPGTSGREVGNTYSANGFEITGTGPSYLPNAQFHVFDQGNALWTGTPGLTLFAVGGRIELKSVEDLVFNLSSIDIARGDTNRGPVPVGFTGYRVDGTTAQAVYRFSDQIIGRNETFTFGSDFQGLTSVVWYQGAEWHQFDNINLSFAVPEPGTASLVLLGALASVVCKRRKRLIKHDSGN